jgi:MFS family permease
MNIYRNIPYVLQLIWSTGFNSVSKIFPSYFATLISASQISLIYSIYACSKFFAIPMGWVSDKIGKSRALIIAFLALPLVAFLFTISSSWMFFGFMFFVIGLLGNFYYSSVNSLITIFFKEKTKALFRLESMYQLGVIIGPIIGGFLVADYGLEAVFYVWGILGIIGFIFSLFLRKEEIVKKVEKKKPSIKKLFKKLGDNKFEFITYLTIGGFLTGFFEAAITIAFPLLMTAYGYDIKNVGVIIGLGSVISIIGLLLIGKNMDKMGYQKSLLVTSLMMGITFLLVFSNNFWLAIIVLGIFTIGRAGGLNIVRAFISENIPEEVRATGMSINDTAQYSARVVAPLVVGFLIDLVGINAPFILLFILTILSIIGLILIKKIKRFS